MVIWVTHVWVAGVRAESLCLVLAGLNVAHAVECRWRCARCVALASRRRAGGCEGLALCVSGSAGGSVGECLFVTICHCSKYAFIVVRCQRAEGVGFPPHWNER